MIEKRANIMRDHASIDQVIKAFERAKEKMISIKQQFNLKADESLDTIGKEASKESDSESSDTEAKDQDGSSEEESDSKLQKSAEDEEESSSQEEDLKNCW